MQTQKYQTITSDVEGVKQKSFFMVFTILCIIALSVDVFGDQWVPPREEEFFSAQRKYMVRITPHKKWSKNPGHCLATMFKIEGEKQTKVWSRNLINRYAPVSVFVADSGQYVITMDEWHELGALPIVIYGTSGKLIRSHTINSLGLRDDSRYIMMTVSSYWWNEDSISFFGPDQETFIMRLHWGKILFLCFKNGDLMDDKWYEAVKGKLITEKKWQALQKYANKQIKKNAIKFLDSRDPRMRKTGVLVCGHEQIKLAIPRLRELLTDDEYYLTSSGDSSKWTKVYYIREAAKKVLESMEQEVDDIVIMEPEKLPDHIK